jgi:hypothetical protein
VKIREIRIKYKLSFIGFFCGVLLIPNVHNAANTRVMGGTKRL